MPLNNAKQRLSEASQEGSRATNFFLMGAQRNRNQAALIKQLQENAAKQIQFNAYADQGQRQVSPVAQDPNNPGGYLGGNGKFGGKFAMYPLKGNLRVSSPYGATRKGHAHPHTGIDWADPAGTPIYAPADAVIRSELFNKIYGNQTILDFGGGYSAMFGHQSKFGNFKPGQSVKAGQLIGYVGSTGWSTGPHLHFETWVNNKPVNPLSWFV